MEQEEEGVRGETINTSCLAVEEMWATGWILQVAGGNMKTTCASRYWQLPCDGPTGKDSEPLSGCIAHSTGRGRLRSSSDFISQPDCRHSHLALWLLLAPSSSGELDVKSVCKNCWKHMQTLKPLSHIIQIPSSLFLMQAKPLYFPT